MGQVPGGDGADHGAGWVPGEHSRVLGQRNVPDLLWVPQFIKTPAQDSGRVDDRNWEQVDLLPTIADLAGIQVPWATEGRSQTGPPTRTRTQKWWYDVPGRRQVRDGPANWKVVLAGETDNLVRASEGVRGLYRYGDFADLIYRDPAAVGPISGAPAAAALDDDRLLAAVEPDSGTVPALISGRLASPPPADAAVLVAVNGQVAGGSRLFSGRPGEPAPVRGDHPGLLVAGRRRASPAPALPDRRQRRPATPAAGHPLGRLTTGAAVPWLGPRCYSAPPGCDARH